VLKHYPIARINEEECVGCTQCLSACPFDAIHGAQQQMHVVVENYCIGCELCLPACPVDCITMSTLTMTHDKRLEQASTVKQRRAQTIQRQEKSLEQKKIADLNATQNIKSILNLMLTKSSDHE